METLKNPCEGCTNCEELNCKCRIYGYCLSKCSEYMDYTIQEDALIDWESECSYDQEAIDMENSIEDDCSIDEDECELDKILEGEYGYDYMSETSDDVLYDCFSGDIDWE